MLGPDQSATRRLVNLTRAATWLNAPTFEDWKLTPFSAASPRFDIGIVQAALVSMAPGGASIWKPPTRSREPVGPAALLLTVVSIKMKNVR